MRAQQVGQLQDVGRLVLFPLEWAEFLGRSADPISDGGARWSLDSGSHGLPGVPSALRSHVDPLGIGLLGFPLVLLPHVDPLCVGPLPVLVIDPLCVGPRLVVAAAGKAAAVPPPWMMVRGSIEGSIYRWVDWGLGRPQ